MNFCKLCGEALREDEQGFHHMVLLQVPIPTWEACLRAATGDHERILRVHHRLVLDSNNLATLE